MAQKKSLSKNRKRKFLKKLGLALSLRNALVNIQRATQPKPPTLIPGGIVSEIKPWTHPDPVTPFYHRIHNLHPELLESLKAANPGETIIGYRNEDGEIAVKLKPKPDFIINDNRKFVWPEQIPYPKEALLNMDEKEFKAIYCGEWIGASKAASEFYNDHMNNSFQPKY